MKKIIFLIFCGFLASCSSQNKKPDEAPSANLPTDEKTVSDRPTGTVKNESAPIVGTDFASDSLVYSNLNIALKSQNLEQIKQTSQDLLKTNNKDVRALVALAMYHYKKDQHEAALFLLGKALALKPDDGEIYNNLGLIYWAKKDKREAILQFRKSLENGPGLLNAGLNLSSIYLNEKDYTKAMFILEPYEAKFADNLAFLNLFAAAQMGRGKFSEAELNFKKILSQDPSHKYALHNYSILLIDRLGKFQEGLDNLNRLKFVAREFETSQTIKELEIRAKAGLK